METISLILGITALIISVIPFIGILAIVPAIIGIMISLISFFEKLDRPKKIVRVIVGFIFNIIATFLVVVWTMISIGVILNFKSDTNYNNNYNNIYNNQNVEGTII